MFNGFKKVLTILLIVIEGLLISHLVFADSWSYDIETSRGTKTIVLPDGMTFEEAYIEMSKLYIEERYNLEDLMAQTDELVKKAEAYEASSEALQKLQKELSDKTEEINNLYKKLNRTRVVYFLAEAGVSSAEFKKIDRIDAGFGVLLFETVALIGEVSYPWSFGIKAGVKF